LSFEAGYKLSVDGCCGLKEEEEEEDDDEKEGLDDDDDDGRGGGLSSLVVDESDPSSKAKGVGATLARFLSVGKILSSETATLSGSFPGPRLRFLTGATTSSSKITGET
jgi:hypothetical protein